MLEVLEAILLGVVQGLTEFLPVSSSGHLLLGQYFLGLDQDRFGLPFDVALHLGTLVAVVSFFWRDLLRMAGAFARSLTPGGRDFSDPDQRLAYLILASTIPAALIGFFLEDFFETSVRNPWVVVFNLVLVGVLFIVVRRGKQDPRGRQAEVLGGYWYRARAGGGARPRSLALRGNDHARALPGSAARGSGPLLVPDERPHHRGGRLVAAHPGGVGGDGTFRGAHVRGGLRLLCFGRVPGDQVLPALRGPPLPACLRLLPLRARRRRCGDIAGP